MQHGNKNLVVIFIMLALFTGATIELSEGSTFIGIILMVLAALTASRMELCDKDGNKNSRNYFLVGGFIIVVADIIYNIVNKNGVGTLDSMTFFIGFSLIAMGNNKKDIRQLGEFGLYISIIFTTLYVIFYALFGIFKIDFIHLFDHYFVLMPTVAIIKSLGVPVEIIAIETVIINGAEPMTIVIGGPCSGLYSMFLLIAIVAGYSIMEKMNLRKTLGLLGLAVAIAYLANLARVIILYVTAYIYGLDVMMMVHTHIGWIIFALTAGGIMYIINRK